MKILIGGDVSVVDSAELFAKGEVKALFNDVTEEFATADAVLVNLECAVTDKDTEIKKFGPCLKAPFGTVETLKKAGVTHCAISNNHIFDYGIVGAKDTIKQLNKNRIEWTGFGENDILARRNMVLTDGKVKVAVIAVCEHEYSYALPERMGVREYDPYDTNEDISEAKKTADFVVVLYHGGKEFCRYPSPRLRKLCRSMVRHGADVVLCQHSHCIGCYEKFDEGHILYGQGNFHFLKSDFLTTEDMCEKWSNGFLVELGFDKTCEIDFKPIVVDGLGIRFANQGERKEIMDSFAKRNEELVSEEWQKGWHEFCLSKQDIYEQAVQSYGKEQTERNRHWFAHYLDCEAHTDVWRELFPTWNKINR